MSRTSARRWRTGATAGLAVLALTLTACTADPPPPIEQAEPTPPPAPAPKRTTVVVSVDEIGSGFNPHLLADQTPVANAVAELVLPSAFRAVPDPERPAASVWVPDDALLISAEVTDENPFTITYRLRGDAQWSDGAPIAAEDFRYLWRQMVTQPGVVDPAGYRLIDDVKSSGGGKTVTVTLREPYPAWRELFTNLLPAHLVKDTPGGFSTGLSETVPVSGGRFHVDTVDRGRGEVLLERNDRFWGTPAVPDEVLLRRSGSDAQVTQSMRSGDTQVVQHRGGRALEAQLGAVPGVRTGVQLQSRTLDLTLNTRTPELTDPQVRRGLLGLLDPDLLGMVAAGTETGVVPARAQVLAPSDPGYAPSMPPRPDREGALRLLAEAGYLPVPPEPVAVDPAPVPEDAAPAEPSAPVPEPPVTTTPAATTAAGPTGPALPEGTLVRDGRPLTLVVGVPEGDDIARAVARTAVDVWRGAGIDASVEEIEPGELYGESLVEGDVHAIVGWTRAGGDPATAALSRFGCLPAPVDPAVETEETGEATASDTVGADAAVPGATAETTDRPDPEDLREALEAQLEAPSNLSGACVPELEPRLLDGLRGTADAAEILAAAQPQLWDLAVTLPISQDRAVVAAGPGVENVSLTAAVATGILGDASLWSRTTP
ncbi:ABC transporter family substrate-binding protein [Rhodococcus sp. Z13]|uniref:ABC transporter family substrate-binding protein n=1 Tax=Rhodococcus sacchari TaxID=2962047 RepID=A0ACD4DJ52_9NOCA|nr:ABC transporter family substrate-binding protein [Rhodococcus sp. Z13]UYP20037.1 ABC transporter family substrate-binding protein [Rhodococcus sp. Z13]